MVRAADLNGATEGGSNFENLLIQMEDEVDSKIYN